MIDLKKSWDTVAKAASDNKEVVYAVTAAGCILAAVASAIIGQHKAEKELSENLTKGAIAKIEAKYHISTMIFTAGALASTYMGYRVSKGYKDNFLTVSGSYAILSKSYDEVQKTLKESGIQEEVKEQVLQKKVDEQKEDILNTVKSEEHHEGDTLFIEETTGQKWWSTREDVKSGINKVNWRMNSANGDPTASINDLLTEFGLKRLGVTLGDEIGWDRNYTGLIDPYFYRPTFDDPDDIHANVWVLGYYNEPKFNFGRELY